MEVSIVLSAAATGSGTSVVEAIRVRQRNVVVENV